MLPVLYMPYVPADFMFYGIVHVLWHSARRPVPDSTVRFGIRHGYKQAAMTYSVQGLLRHTGYRTRRSTSGRTSG